MKVIKICYICIILIFLSSCTIEENADAVNIQYDNKNLKKTIVTVLSSKTEKNKIIETTEENTIDKLMKSMTLEEKVAELFIVDLESLNDGNTVTSINSIIMENLDKYPVGGVIFFSHNIENIDQTMLLIEDLQKKQNIPLFIAVDEEGGLVSRIAKNENMHATELPGNMTIGNTKDEKIAYDVGRLLGVELKSLGFNLDFAPVADVNTNPDNPVIGVRSFGSDPDLVGSMVNQMVKGIQSVNVCATLKHFPGHGDTSNDSHQGSVYVNHDIERLRTIEWVPFKSGIKADVDFIMTAHINLPNILKKDVVSTMSYEVITEYLKNELNFNGIVITDALNMKAITDQYTSEEAVKNTFLAGVDMLLMPKNFKDAYRSLLDSVKNGEISERRLDESVKKILETKIKRKFFEESNHYNPKKVLGSNEHKKIIESIN